jgi:hypothetical protein
MKSPTKIHQLQGAMSNFLLARPAAAFHHAPKRSSRICWRSATLSAARSTAHDFADGLAECICAAVHADLDVGHDIAIRTAGVAMAAAGNKNKKT